MFLHVFIAGENKHVQLYTANWYGRITLICTNGPVWFCLSHERVQMFGYIDLSHTQTICCVHNIIYIYTYWKLYIYIYISAQLTHWLIACPMIDTSISGCFINDLLSGNQTTWHHGNEEVYINHLLLWEIIQAITICY